MSIKVETFWEASVILLTNDDSPYILHSHVENSVRFLYGISNQGSIDLSLKEAKKLQKDLEDSIRNYERLEAGLGIDIYSSGDGV